MDSAELRLVLVENGAKLPDPRPNEDIGDIVVVVQRDRERPSEIALRAARHIARAETIGRRIRHSVLVVGAQNDPLTLACRALLARALVTHQVRTGSGEVVICAPSSASIDARRELMALAGTLTSELRGSPVNIRVLFGGSMPASHADEPGAARWLESGIHCRVAAAAAG